MSTIIEHRSPEVLEDLQLRHIRVQLNDVKIRTSGESGGGITLDGHAAVYDTPTTLLEVPGFRIVETIASGAFRNALDSNPDVHLNINHDMRLVMARTGVSGIGGLELTEDETGLRVFARLDPEVSYISDLTKLMRAGVVDQMSFYFIPGEMEETVRTEADGSETIEWTQTSFGGLRDVCVCPQGAYPTTDASVREFARTRATSRVAPGEGTNELVEGADLGVAQSETIAQGVPVGSDVEEERIAARKLEVRKILAKVNTPTHKEI